MPRHAPDDRSDHALLDTLTHALASGDAGAVDQAFETIYNTYAGSVAFVCGRFLSDDTDVRSVTDDVFVSFFQRVPYIEIESLRAYLCQAARRAALDHLRAKKRRERGLTDLRFSTDGKDDTDPLTLLPDPDEDIPANTRYKALTADLCSTVGQENTEIVLSHADRKSTRLNSSHAT